MSTEEHPLLQRIRIERGKRDPITEEDWFELLKHMMVEVCVLDWLRLSKALKGEGCPLPPEAVVAFMTMNTPFKHKDCIEKGCKHIFDWMEEKGRPNKLDIKIHDN